MTATYYSDNSVFYMGVQVLLNTSTLLPTRAALPGASAPLAPNPIHSSTLLTATGPPAATTQLTATLIAAVGRPVRRITVPATAGAATSGVPTAGLAAGSHLLWLKALDAQSAALGALPTQCQSVAAATARSTDDYGVSALSGGVYR